jgi:hypothetical protein
MFKSKLIRLYKTLNESELRQLKKWVVSPVHNKHKDVQLLFDFLFSRKTITNITTQRERATEYIYPNEKLNMPRLRHVMSFATDVLEDFIRYTEYVFDDKNAKIILLGGLRKRNLKKDAQREEQLIRKILKNEKVQNENYYWLKYQLEKEQFRLHTEGDRPTNTNLQEVMNSSSLFFVLSTLRYACICISHQNLYKTEYQIPFIDAILRSIENNEFAKINSIQLYYYCYLSLTHPDEDSPYMQLKSYLVRFPDILPANEYKEVYETAINYCIKRLNKGNKHYAEEAFELYMKGIANKALLDSSYLSHFAYKNIVAIGLFLEKTQEIKTFITEGGTLLNPTYSENYIHYNLAKFYFSTKEYNKAKEMLITMEYDDIFMTVDAKMMLMKIFVMQKEFDLMESFVHSFSQYLHRKSELSYHRKSVLNTVRLTQKVMHAFTAEEKKALAKKIESTDPLPEKKWLLEQLNS